MNYWQWAAAGIVWAVTMRNLNPKTKPVEPGKHKYGSARWFGGVFYDIATSIVVDAGVGCFIGWLWMHK